MGTLVGIDEGFLLGVNVGFDVGKSVLMISTLVGLLVTTGLLVMRPRVGSTVGISVGLREGVGVGLYVGDCVGSSVGDNVLGFELHPPDLSNLSITPSLFPSAHEYPSPHQSQSLMFSSSKHMGSSTRKAHENRHTWTKIRR